MKYLKTIYLLFSTSLLGNFDNLWHETQNIYHNLILSIESTECDQIDAAGRHSEWLMFREQIKQHIFGTPKRNFLNENSILSTMLRTGIGKAELFELDYLQNRLSYSTTNIMHQFVETDFHLIPKECAQLNCTSTSLCHLFYLAKILENCQTFGLKPFQTIVEFGGGFGNLCHIVKQLFPQTTYIIFDIPEVIAIQYLFLKGALPEHAVKVHMRADEAIEPYTINLIPSVFCKNIECQADLFISTFALSETTEEMQRCIQNKKFYNARICYITGQLFNTTEIAYTHHSILHEAVQELFAEVHSMPFHAPADSNSTYELIGVNRE